MNNYGTSHDKKQKIQHVTNVMRDNIKDVVERDTRLNEIEHTAVNLSKRFPFNLELWPFFSSAAAADSFKTMSKSTEAKYRWEKIKYSNVFKLKQSARQKGPISQIKNADEFPLNKLLYSVIVAVSVLLLLYIMLWWIN